MARFVLVHGAFSGAWIWAPLMERLQAAGHSVEAFDLPGLGDDHTPVSEVTLDACAARLCEVLATSSEPAIVVGNSMGGIIATQGAARCPERVAALVYVAAFMPKDGQSLLDLTKLPEGAGDQVQANLVVEGEPPVATMPAAASGPALYGSCAEDVAAWAIARQRPQPVAPFATPVSIPSGALDGINRYAVLCTQIEQSAGIAATDGRRESMRRRRRARHGSHAAPVEDERVGRCAPAVRRADSRKRSKAGSELTRQSQHEAVAILPRRAIMRLKLFGIVAFAVLAAQWPVLAQGRGHIVRLPWKGHAQSASVIVPPGESNAPGTVWHAAGCADRWRWADHPARPVLGPSVALPGGERRVQQRGVRVHHH